MSILSNQPSFRSAWINVTRQCNLRCKYCFINKFGGDESRSGDMSFNTILASIEYLYKYSEEGVAVAFFGGEPLIRFDMIRDAMDRYPTMLFMISTNATMLNGEMVDYFKKKRNSLEVILSIDGDKDTQLSNRGHSIDEELVSELFSSCHRTRARMTVLNPESCLSDMRYLVSLGAKRITVNIPHDVELSKEYFSKMKLAQESVRLDPELSRISTLSKEPLGKICGDGYSHCRVGDEYITVDIDGSIYPCDLFRLKNSWRLGDVFNGIDHEIYNRFMEYIGNEKKETISLCIGEQIFDRDLALINNRNRETS